MAYSLYLCGKSGTMIFDGGVATKLPRTGLSIFSHMSQLAQAEQAVNLSQGFPDFPVDPVLIGLVERYMRDGHNQYAPMAGVPALREAIAGYYQNVFGRTYNPAEEITITAGATQAIYTAISALIKEEDEVIIFTPAYDCYEPPVLLNNARPVYVQLKAPDFKVNWQEVKKVVNRKTRMIIINTPHNPTGMVWDKQDMKELERLTAESQIIILSDEVYQNILFDKRKHYSAAAFEGLAERSLVIGSFGKTFHATGWKTGYICGPENLMAEFRKVHQYTVFSVNAAIQHAFADYLGDADNYLKLGDFYQKKRDLFLSLIENSRFKFKPAAGTYFQLLSYKGISGKPEVEFAEELTRQNKIASIPVSVFYNQPIEQYSLRFCFAKSDETLRQAAEILNAV